MIKLIASLAALSMATPAFAYSNFSKREKGIYDFAYDYGYLVAMCSSYAWGESSRSFFRGRALYIKNKKDTPIKFWRAYVEAFEEASQKLTDTRKCYQIMKEL